MKKEKDSHVKLARKYFFRHKESCQIKSEKYAQNVS